MDTDRRLPRLDRLVVTRPAAEAGRWVETLNGAGWPAQALPLISIGGPRSPEALQALEQARAQWAQWDALMFVSNAAVAHFFAGACAPAAGANHTRFWAPGPGTGRALAQALRGLGLGADRIDAPRADAAQFDSEALWPVVQDQMGPGKRLLVVRGDSTGIEMPAPNPQLAGHGREWLIQQCEALGAQVHACVAYERSAPQWSALLRAQAAAAAAPGSLWLLSSSEALVHLRAGLPEVHWTQATALTTHPRIADAAREAGFGEVQTARPALPDVLRALESHWSPP
jgi:uroporphyrinogen-III synthase